MRKFRWSDDDYLEAVGSMLIVLAHDGRLRAIFVAAGDGRISSIDPDAGTYYVDEPYRRDGIDQCLSCSRFGHDVQNCGNKGVRPSTLQYRQNKTRRARHAKFEQWNSSREQIPASP